MVAHESREIRLAWMIRKLNAREEGHPELESPLRTNFIR